MQQLSNLDSTFLSLESYRTPMHIGCIWTFEAPKSGDMTFHRFRQHIESRLPISPVFRRRLSSFILDIDRPYWIEDSQFDLKNHLKHVYLYGENSGSQRSNFINNFFSEILDTSRPLWEMLFIENSNSKDGEFSVLLKFHHAAVDGKSAEKILAGLLSSDPEGIDELNDTWEPEQASMSKMAKNRIKSLYHAPKGLMVLSNSFSNAVNRSRSLRRRDQEQQPPHFFKSPPSFFNGQVEPTRVITSAHLSMANIKAVRKAYPGCTLNDVVLTVCAGALRKYLMNHDQLPKSPMVAMVPVSKRAGEEEDQGNLISPMLVSLATDLDSPVSRLEKIHLNAQKAKEYNNEVAMEQVIAHLPSWSSSWVMKAYTRLRIAKRMKPVFNLVITNVPGPASPLYFDGAKLKSMEGMAPIADGMGLTLVVTSYTGTLTVAVTSTEATAGHAPEFIQYLHESLSELEEALELKKPQVQEGNNAQKGKKAQKDKKLTSAA